MEKDIKRLNFIKGRLFWIVLGLVLAGLSMVPYFLLKEASVITYHDQLDGELITYILNAKHLFDGSKVYPEIMNGISKNGMVSPAPFFVLLYVLFKPFTAFLISMGIVRVISFVSMFLLLNEFTERKWLSFLGAVFFMLLPFYTVYGLCIPGQPLIYYVLLRFRKEKFEWPLLGLVVLFSGASSLALCGYAMLSVCGVVFIITLVKKKSPLRYLVVCLVMGVTYLLCNLSLVLQALGFAKGFVSHKSEMVSTPQPFLKEVFNLLFTGASYTEAFQAYCLPLILFSVALSLILGKKKRKEATKKAKICYGVLAGILCISFVSAFFSTKLFQTFASGKSGVIRDFNFSRFSWLLTVLWVVEIVLCFDLLLEMFSFSNYKKWVKGVCLFLGFVSILASTFFVFMKNDLKPNLIKLVRHGDYYMMTWKQFYAEDLFSEVDSMIGKDKSTYRVVSLGIYPAAASYNGFYCLDAYSNNYDVNYKHEFRKVISPMLDRSEYLRDWFDNWGNRCYLVLEESNNYFTFEKRWTPYTSDYGLDFEALHDMGCDYLISATYLIDCENYGLTMLNSDDEHPIVSDDSWYRLWVYKING